jgi:hypothetical protein
MPKIWLSGIIASVATACDLCPAPALAEAQLSAPSNAPLSEIPHPAPTGGIDIRTQREVMNQLAGALESQYANEDAAKKLATFVSAKAKSNA